jgi:hypothetical protein
MGPFTPIGVMMPEGSLLRLKKRFSKNALSGLGLITVTEYRLIRAGDVYAQGGQPSESRPHQPQPLPMQQKNEQAPVQAQVQQEPARTLQPDVSGSAQQYHVPNPNQSMESKSSLPKKTDVRPDDAWRPIEDASTLFSDPELKQAGGAVTGGLVRKSGSTTYLAVPVSPEKPFPAMPIFCFGTMEAIRGASYIVFSN